MEIEDGQRFSESLVKQLTGGDVISARFMRGEWFTFKPAFKIWLAVNHKPTVRGTDKGIWRRLRLIPFTVSFPDEKQDKTLPARLRAELPGLLKWAVDGCLEWQQSGLGIPNEVRQATDAYQSENDVVGQFIEEKCIVNESTSVRSGRLFEMFKEWCSANGEHEYSNKWLTQRLAEKGFQKKTRNDGAWWIGLGLLAE
jgi:putative DNA primase/helicase